MSKHYQVDVPNQVHHALYRVNGAQWVPSGTTLDMDGPGKLVAVEETMSATADRLDGMAAEKYIKVNAGDAIAGIGLSAYEDPQGNTTSAFTVQVDQFALVPAYDFYGEAEPNATGAGQSWYKASTKTAYRSTGAGTINWVVFVPLVPFGVDLPSNTAYINGQLRVSAGGQTLEALAAGTTVFVSYSSPYFKYDIAGAIVNPTVTLTANFTGDLYSLFNTAFVTWTAVSGYTGTLPAAGTNNTLVLNEADMPGESATLRASIDYQGRAYTDEVTILKLRDGASALSALLTNEAHTVPANSIGSVTSWTGAGGSMRAYLGSALLTTGVTYSVLSNPNALTVTISAAGVYSVTAAGSWASGTATTTVTFRATVGTAVLDKVFTLTKALTGVQGSTGATGSTGAAGANGLDGNNGTNGTNGTNGAAHVTKASTTSTVGGVSTTELNSAISTTMGRSAQVGDAVTLHNASAQWSQTWVRGASGWGVATLYIDGNAVITGTLYANTLSTSKVVIGFIGSNVTTSIPNPTVQITNGTATLSFTTSSLVVTPLWSWASYPPDNVLISLFWSGNNTVNGVHTVYFTLRAINMTTGLAYTGNSGTLKVWMF